MQKTLLDWLGTFWKVLVSPTPQTFLQEAKKADGKFASALGWLVLYAISIVIMMSIAVRQALDAPTVVTVLILVPLTVILFTSVINFICRGIFHPKEYIYDKLLYITVSVLLPIFIVFFPVGVFIDANIFKVLIFILFFYQAAMLTIGVKTIVNIAYWQAFVTVVFSLVAGILIGGIIYILIVSTISPPRLTQTQ